MEQACNLPDNATGTETRKHAVDKWFGVGKEVRHCGSIFLGVLEVFWQDWLLRQRRNEFVLTKDDASAKYLKSMNENKIKLHVCGEQNVLRRIHCLTGSLSKAVVENGSGRQVVPGYSRYQLLDLADASHVEVVVGEIRMAKYGEGAPMASILMLKNEKKAALGLTFQETDISKTRISVVLLNTGAAAARLQDFSEIFVFSAAMCLSHDSNAQVCKA